jgi:integral membrane protein
MNDTKSLRLSGTLEGISYLVLLGIAMPLKYLADSPLAVKYVGWAHGVLFMLFVGLAFFYYIKHKQPLLWFIYAFIAAFLPFGPFIWERRYLD